MDQRIKMCAIRKMKTCLTIFCFSLLLINSSLGQSRCDKVPDSVQVFAMVDQMPEPKMDMAELTNLLNAQIDLNNFEFQPLETVFFGVTINCKGEAFDFKILREIHSDLDKEMIKVIKSNMSWFPGKFRDEPVDVRITERVYIVEGEFRALSEKQLKKVRKKIK